MALGGYRGDFIDTFCIPSLSEEIHDVRLDRTGINGHDGIVDFGCIGP